MFVRNVVKLFSVSFICCFLLSGFLMLIAPQTAQAVLRTTLYVKAGSTGSCSSWDDACDLQDALGMAVSGDQIWVAEGTYYPGSAGVREAIFELKEGVSVYGGFAGTETSLTQRNWTANPTILSGDIDKNSTLDTGNSYHVVYIPEDVTLGTVLDGFTITGGNDDGYWWEGGGIYCDGSPTLNHLIIDGNAAPNEGGGMVYYGENQAILNNVTFSNNTSSGSGGGLSSWYPIALNNVTFINNHANYGGGMAADDGATLDGVVFADNIAVYNGGGLHFDGGYSFEMNNISFSGNNAENGGGLYSQYDTSVTMTNVKFLDNIATASGGGIYQTSGVYFGAATFSINNALFAGNAASALGGGLYMDIASMTLINSTFSLNTAGTGGGIYSGFDDSGSTSVTMANSILRGNSATYLGTAFADIDLPFSSTVTYTDLNPALSNNVSAGTGCIDEDPLFADVTDFHLQFGSPAINTGHDASVTTGVTTALDGNARFVGTVDMGAYEYETASAPVVTTSPTDLTVIVGERANFSAAADGYPVPTVQWQISRDSGGSWTDIPEGQSIPYSFLAMLIDDATQFRAVFTNTQGSVPSNSATLMVNSVPAVITSADHATFTAGSSGSFTFTATGAPVPVISYSGTLPSGVVFNSGAATLSGTPAIGSGGTYTLTITASNGVTTDAEQTFTLTINEAPVVTSQPSNQEVTEGESATFTAAAGGYPAPSVKWQVSKDSGSTWNDITSATSTTYTIGSTTLDMHNYQYRAVFSNGVGSNATSDAALLTVNRAQVAPSITSSNAATFTVGSAGSFTITTSGYPIPAITKDGTLPGGVNFSDNGDGTATLSGTPDDGTGGEHGLTFRALNVVSHYDQSFTLTINEAPDVTVQPSDATVKAGDTATFTAAATGFPAPSVKWQVSTDGGTNWDDIAGATTASYNTSATHLMRGYKYRAVFHNSVSDVDTNAVTLTVNGARLYVNAFAVGANNGTGWTNAYTDLQSALDEALTGDEIWVATGTYKPSLARESYNDRTKTFQLKDGVALYGGFAGTESNLNERNWATHTTTLSGDIDGNEILDNGNAYNVVYVPKDVTDSAILDGFTITGGYADGASTDTLSGGGITCFGWPVLQNLIIDSNQAGANYNGGGGGAYIEENSEGHPVLNDITFSNNEDGGTGGGGLWVNCAVMLNRVTFTNNKSAGYLSYGGGMKVYDCYTSPASIKVNDVTFSGNEADRGGGLYLATYGSGGLEDLATLTNVKFLYNKASFAYGGGIYSDGFTLSIRDGLFIGNEGYTGGGIYNESGSLVLANSTFSKNKAAPDYGYGGAVEISEGTLTAVNSIFWGNTAANGPDIDGSGTVSYSDYNPTLSSVDVTDGGHNINIDPLFVDPDNAVPENRDFRIQPTSLAIDAGDTAAVPDDVTKDLDGLTRVDGTAVDMGPYEYQGSVVAYTVTFDSKGGSAVNARRVISGGLVAEPTPPTRTGYTFDGWYEEEVYTNLWNFANDTVTSNMTLYAKWTINQYTVTFEPNGGTGSMSPQNGNYNTTAALTSNSFTKTGYTFAGWNTQAGGGGIAYGNGADYTFTTSITLHAQWIANSYTVTFDANGGTPTPDPQTVNYGSTYGELPTVSRTGYTFNGWFTAASGGTPVTSGTTVTTADNHTLYAQWTANAYTVTFDGNGGGTPTPSSRSVTYGSTYGTLATVSRTGYTFNGWFTAASGGTQVTSDTTVTTTDNHTLYAKWTADNYSVTYNGNTNTGGSVPTDSTNYHIGDTVTVLGNTSGLTKTGYTFAGWNTQADGNGTPYTASQTFIMGSSNVTLYAKWTINQYTVTFEPNGGTGSMSPQNGNYNTTAALTSNSFTKTGYTFAGWNTQAGGGGIAYGNGADYTFTTSITLYAQWTANSYTVTFDANGGTPTPDPQTVNYGSTYGELPTVSRTGYTFNGWFTAESGGTQVTSDTTVTTADNHTLYAHWAGIALEPINGPLTVGTSYTIAWTCEGEVGAYATIELLQNGAVVKTIKSRVNISSPSGSFSWKPAGKFNNNDYYIRITSNSNASYTDTSGNFKIISRR